MSLGRSLFVATCAALLLFGAEIQAGGCAKCRLQAAWGLAAQPESEFNTATIARHEGQVVSVQKVDKDRDVVDGVYVLLKTDKGNVSVRLGPDWYLQREGFSVEPYDTMEVVASEVKTVNARPALVAIEARANGKRTVLRDSKGQPLWNKRR